MPQQVLGLDEDPGGLVAAFGGHGLVHPPAAFLRNYVLRRGFTDGTVGLTISLVNSYGVFLKFAKLWERQRQR